MNYRQLQTALKAYRAQGYDVPKLNSKKVALEQALDEIEQLRAGEAPPSKEYMKALLALANRGDAEEARDQLFWENLSCPIPRISA